MLLEEISIVKYWKFSKEGFSKKFITTTELSTNKKHTSVTVGDNSTFKKKIIEYAKVNQLDSQPSRHALELLDRKVYTLSIYQLIFNSKTDAADSFIKYAKEKIIKDLCKEAEGKTRNQKDDVL